MMLAFQNTNTATKVLDNASYITDVAVDSINNLITSIIARMPYLMAGILVLGLFYLLAKVVKWIFWAASRKTKLDQRLRILFSRLIVVFIIVLGIFTSLTVIVPSFSFGSLIAGLGFTSFVIGFATKDILNNLVSGILILWNRTFSIGDYIFVGNNQGKVEFIGVRATTLRKDDGETIIIPNGDMYSSALTIRGAGARRRMNLAFSIGYDADIESAKKLTKIALDTSEGVVNEPQPTVLVTALNSDGVTITVNFWINPEKTRPREVYDHAAINIMKALSGVGIELFPPGSVIVQQPRDAGETDERRNSTGA
ncbi:MAG TPA: mechanosensitive ion channel family protein [Pyrinomonadaceae bacterium]|jgi:small-conductance mechanosensitive channel|nr:mechanosensitive ion channel family protein [Pyrinomonadaceae bacterium]